MARYRKTSFIEDLLVIASKLPWWLSLAIGTLLYLWLHAVAIKPVAMGSRPDQYADMLTGSAFKTVAGLFQYVLPVVFGIGAIVSIVGRYKRKALLESIKPGGNTLDGISWREFEMLVGEAFRRQGFSVQETTSGADGGVDLVLHRDGEKHLVQCKQWRATRVSVMVVRELFGVMAATGAVGGFVVTSGRFTAEARAFAEGRNVRLVEAEELSRWIAQSRKGAVFDEHVEPVAPTAQAKPAAAPPGPTIACPLCRAPMVLRTARKGPNVGNEFWGCSRFPGCLGKRPAGAPTWK
jgi:restriction system protein